MLLGIAISFGSSAPSRQSNGFLTGGTHERAASFRGALAGTGNGPLGVV